MNNPNLSTGSGSYRFERSKNGLRTEFVTKRQAGETVYYSAGFKRVGVIDQRGRTLDDQRHILNNGPRPDLLIARAMAKTR
jgi:hypothetical protein